LVYGRPCSVSIDPIEKKPLYHFLPGHKSLSISTVGCNLRCKHCQNHEISQSKAILGEHVEPERVIEYALQNSCRSISYTYTEPTIFFEYALDIMKLARKSNLKNIIVSNGFTGKEARRKWVRYLDAANIDLKGDSRFYKDITASWIEPVQESIEYYKKKGIWLELTNLIIPGLNNSPEQLTWLCSWIADNVGTEVPLHFSRFFPMYKLDHLMPTPPEDLLLARQIASDAGINYVYIGNLAVMDGGNTRCPECNALLIERLGFSVAANKVKGGKCLCGAPVNGIWQ